MLINSAITDTLSQVHNQRYTDTVVKAVERINTGLKINDASDDSASYSLASNLRKDSSSLLKGIENANSGLGLVEVSNKALTQQEDILNLIKDRLELAKLGSTDTASKDTIRTQIQDLIQKFDDIASNTSYNNNYTLQRSNSDNAESLSISFTFNANSVSTEPIRSNSEGVNLTTLKNLASGELDYDSAVTQLANVESSLEQIDDYQDALKLTQTELAISIENLTGIEEKTKASELNITQADLIKEQAVFDKYKLLVDSSEYALSQAHTTQQTVLDLLTTIPDYVPSVENKTTYTNENDNDKDESFVAKKETPTYTSSSSTSSSSSATSSSGDSSES